MISTDNFQTLKGKYFKYLSGVYLCKNISPKKYGNYLIETDKKTLVVNDVGFKDIEPLSPDNLEAQSAARLRAAREGNKDKVAPISISSYQNKIRSKSRRKKAKAEPKEHIDEVFAKVIVTPKRATTPAKVKEPKMVKPPKVKKAKKEKKHGKIKAIIESTTIFTTGKFEPWEDALLLDDENDIATLFEKTKRAPAKLYARRWYLKEKQTKGIVTKVKEPKPAKEKKERKGRESAFTKEQDALILSTGSEKGAMKRLAERLGQPKTKVIARKLYLNRQKKAEGMEYLEYKIGNTVKDQYGDEGVIVNVEKKMLKTLYVVQVVNVKSKLQVYRGMKRRYASGNLQKIEKISPK